MRGGHIQIGGRRADRVRNLGLTRTIPVNSCPCIGRRVHALVCRDQLSNAIPTRSSRRQISRQMRAVRKLSKDNSNFDGSKWRPSSLIRAPKLVTSTTMPVVRSRCALKNSRTAFEIAVLPTARLSMSPFFRMIDVFLVDPMPAITASPNLPAHQPARDRSPGNDDVPGVPNVGRCRPSRRTSDWFDIPAVCRHSNSHRGADWRAVACRPRDGSSERRNNVDAKTLFRFSGGATKSGC
jgi:hypothetical protein